MVTPSFPAFRSRFGGLERRVRRVRTATLCQLEEQLGGWIPEKLLAPANEGANSRDRIYINGARGRFAPSTRARKSGRKLPTMTVRVVRFVLPRKGYRTRRVSLVTTLLDPQAYPLEALAELYRRRWRLELCFRDPKTTMGMEHLRCQSPAMARKELLAYLIAHNLIRCLMAQAAARHTVDLERVSFKGSVDAARQYSGAMAQARNAKQRERLHEQLLENLARDLVPDRPGRREPRAVKRRPKPYQLLTEPRGTFQEIPHRGKYRKPDPAFVPLT